MPWKMGLMNGSVWIKNQISVNGRPIRLALLWKMKTMVRILRVVRTIVFSLK
jgi:hypothetical protein